jgi:RsiW-degrading membrane proteinase PrsW (M82 family)
VAIFVFLINVAAPAVFWLWFFSRVDRQEPEPRRLIAKVFVLGMAILLFSFAVEQTLFSVFAPEVSAIWDEVGTLQSYQLHPYHLLALFAVGGAIEEVIKYFALKEFVYQRPEFNQIHDGIVYAVSLALGFSFLENSLYFFQFLALGTPALVIGTLLRGVSTMLLHLTASGIAGYGLGVRKFSSDHERRTARTTLVIALLLHAGYNMLVMEPLGLLIAFPILLAAFIVLYRLFVSRSSSLIWSLGSTNRPQS